MGCEECFITRKLIVHSYLVLNLDNCAHKTSTGLKRPDETGEPPHSIEFIEFRSQANPTHWITPVAVEYPYISPPATLGPTIFVFPCNHARTHGFAFLSSQLHGAPRKSVQSSTRPPARYTPSTRCDKTLPPWQIGNWAVSSE